MPYVDYEIILGRYSALGRGVRFGYDERFERCREIIMEFLGGTYSIDEHAAIFRRVNGKHVQLAWRWPES